MISKRHLVLFRVGPLGRSGRVKKSLSGASQPQREQRKAKEGKRRQEKAKEGNSGKRNLLSVA